MKTKHPRQFLFYSITFISLTLLIPGACFDKPSSTPITVSHNNSILIFLNPIFSNLEFNKSLAIYQSTNSHWFSIEQAKAINLKNNSIKKFLGIRDEMKFDSSIFISYFLENQTENLYDTRYQSGQIYAISEKT